MTLKGHYALCFKTRASFDTTDSSSVIIIVSIIIYYLRRRKEVMYLPLSVCLFVCPTVCQITIKSYKGILIIYADVGVFMKLTTL